MKMSFTLGIDCLSRRPASNPFNCGMAISSTMMSGCSFSATFKSARPSQTKPTISYFGSSAIELSPGLVRSAVFHHVAQGFLGNSEKAQPHILRNPGRMRMVGEGDLDLKPRAQLFTKTH